MALKDRSVRCFDCGTIFTFGIVAQEYFLSRGFAGDPSRCRICHGAWQAYRTNTGSNPTKQNILPAQYSK